ncbi:MAG: FtsX-like permease family protein [Candidatus Cloacimonetes bacterium]|nr:FtsX-like permease family protein [Candidatus Cloacimonadota bacterium]MCF7814846.1 FtsX-like permease family protein [Candidatus Cloacimonadota bacterium]MCF7867902.1 FtsX-like permease family protein [Candidatus Cloacimonadota bacterium]MCF7883721.1 FtsX-like permease family protein [Candidatus Cloacimonadota bacterium]
MFKFIIKGLLKDRSRSLFPILTISAGVMLTVLMYSWLNGFATMTIRENARFSTGHIKIMTRAYEKMAEQRPLDLALLGTDEIVKNVREKYPEITWLPRIYFGGLLDLPDENGETKSQGEIMGMAVDLLSNNKEKDLLNLEKAVIQGRLPGKQGEILISQEVADKMGIKLQDDVTVITSTMFGSLSMYNFNVCGTITFGVSAMDRGAVIIDLSDARYMLDMENGASEILGIMPKYDEEKTYKISVEFNSEFTDESDQYSSIMKPLREQNNLDFLISSMDERLGTMIFIFVFIMSLVLWNAGLMNGIRRYGEVGVRLAIGESKGHIYRMMIFESLMIGVAGTIIGTAIGLIFSYILQYTGIDISNLMKDAKVLMSTKMQAQVNSTSYVIGLLPGILSSVLGAVISGIGIYKRNTAQLFKELET